MVSDCDNTDDGDYGIIYLNHHIMAVPAAAAGDDDGDGDAVVAAATVNNDDDYKKYNDLFRLQYLRFSLFHIYVNMVFVIRRLYSAVSLTLVREQRFIRIDDDDDDDDDDDGDDDDDDEDIVA